MSLILKNKEDLICDNLDVTEDGILTVRGHKVTDLVEKYDTPLYLIDEIKVREKCQTFINSAKRNFKNGFRILYASKALSFKQMYRIMSEVGMGIDVVSCGEIATADCAGYDLSNAFFHSNNKTDKDIEFAMEKGVGFFVADNEEELYAIERVCEKLDREQKVLLRITPGIDPHTYDAVSTGKVDSKFGSAIETGQAEEITKLALALPRVKLQGFHCHVGSQVFDSSVYISTVKIMLNFIYEIKKNCGFEAKILDLGGGFGVPYVFGDGEVNIEQIIDEIGEEVRTRVEFLGLSMPEICFEPGRSIVADAGVTLYRVGTVKKIKGYKNYVSVDGGMTDNPRFLLYGSKYTVLPCSRMFDTRDMEASIVGRCCESGDILQEHINVPSDIKRDDLIAVLTTGAYNYSMASNYNRIPKPPVVMLTENDSYVAVRRETFDDVNSLDV